MNFKKSFAGVVRSRNFSPTVMTALIVVVFLIANILLYMIYDYTKPATTVPKSEDLSLGDGADGILEQAKADNKKITITFCMSRDDIRTHSEGKYVYETALNFKDKYSSDDDFITIKHANIFTLEYDREPGDDGAAQKFNLAEYQKIDAFGRPIYDDQGKQVYDKVRISKSSVIFECETYDAVGNVVTKNVRVVSGSAAFVDFFTLDSSNYITSYNGEEYFTAMFLWVLNNEHKTVYFTMGHGEVPSTNLYTTLIAAGYCISEIDLRKTAVPEDAAFVIISNPKTDFERSANNKYVSEIDRLVNYADKGGKFYVIMDPAAKALPILEKFVAEEFGISFMTDSDGRRLMVKDLSQSINVSGFTGFTIIAGYADSDLGVDIKDNVDKYGGNVIISDSAALKCDSALGAHALLSSSSSATLEAGGESYDESAPYTLLAYSVRENEYAESAKMIFVPSIYFTAGDAMVSNSYANKDFVYSIFDVFYGDGNMPYGIDCIAMQEERLEDLTLGTSLTYASILIAIPLALAVVGTATIIRRKNR